MSFLKHALQLAELGFHVFPLGVNSKLPIIDDFPTRATKDPDQIREWWTDPVMNIERPYNIGISTTEYNCNQALVVVDVDEKGDKRGGDRVFELELQGFNFTPTYEQQTPTGGKHLVYKAPAPVKQGESVLAHGLDIRSKGGYIVGAGSVVDGKHYTMRVAEIQECPAWIVKKCGAPREREVREHIEVDPERAAKRTQHYLEHEAPLAIEGDHGDATTYSVANRCKDFGCDEAQTLELMLEYWNERCQPPWNTDELQRKVENAFDYGTKAPGSSSPEADFEKLEPDEVTKEIQKKHKSYLHKMNDEYALLFGDGNHMVLWETVNEKGRPELKMMSEAAFKRRFSNRLVMSDGDQKPRTWANVWLDWDKRREFSGLCFKPEQKAKNNYYNLWTGFSCSPLPYEQASQKAQEGFDAFMEHVHRNLCAGEDELFKWLMGYFAHLIQRPWERPLTTLVFKGGKGVGKNAAIERVGNLLGTSHHIIVHNSRYLTSNFNGHLDNKLLMVLDEAFWSGEKGADSVLKGITTAPELVIERKGKEPYTVDNLVRVVVIGNEDWLVPASADERRYAVFEVLDHRKKDGAFFKKMIDGIDRWGGNQILLHHLQSFDLKSVNINAAPETNALLEQKLESLNLREQFWYECLSSGQIPILDFKATWPDAVPKSELYDAFSRFVKKKSMRARVPTKNAFGRSLTAFCSEAKARIKIKHGDEFVHAYPLASLESAREQFANYLGQDLNWD